jgi:hypothetical protein
MTSSQKPQAEIRLDSRQADSGGIFPLVLSALGPCQSCSASVHPGRKSMVCPRCNGQLTLSVETSNGRGASVHSGGCVTCHGDGWIVGAECDECDGSARTATTSTIRVRIPAGVKDGQRLRLPARGTAGRPGASAEHFYVTVRVDCPDTGDAQRVFTERRDAKAARAARMERVAKLLRKAEAVAGTPEEAVFLDRAFALMAKYGLEEAMVRASMNEGTNSHGADTPKVVERVFNVTSKYGSHQILSCMANALHCRGVHQKSGPTGCPEDSVRVLLIGMPDHIERVHFLWDLLQPQVLRALALLPEGDSWHSTQSVYRRSWVLGFAIGIASRLREHEQKAVEKAESGKAVMLYDLYKRDEERAEAVIRERWPNLQTEQSSDSFDPCAVADGQRAAQSAALNRSVGDESGPAICA